MRAVLTRTLVIVNPFSRDGATGRRFAGIERRLREVLGPLEVERTRGPRDAERLAREAVRAGVERLIVAGGDGTLSEVASGLLGAGLGAYARIGVLPFGTGGDFVKTLGIPRDLERAIACIAEGKVRRIDASRVTLRGEEGRARVYLRRQHHEHRHQRAGGDAGRALAALRGRQRRLPARHPARDPAPPEPPGDAERGRRGRARGPADPRHGRQRPLLRRRHAGLPAGLLRRRQARRGGGRRSLQGPAAGEALQHLPRHPSEGSRGAVLPRPRDRGAGRRRRCTSRSTASRSARCRCGSRFSRARSRCSLPRRERLRARSARRLRGGGLSRPAGAHRRGAPARVLRGAARRARPAARARIPRITCSAAAATRSPM